MSDVTHIVYNLVVIFALILFIGNGTFLILKGLKNKKKNLVQLGTALILLTSAYLIIMVAINWTLVNTLSLAAYILVIVFVHSTYYTNRKSPIKLILMIAIINWIIQVITSLLFYDIGVYTPTITVRVIQISLDMLTNGIIFLWYGLASYSSLQNLRNKEIEPWIKARLRLVTYSAFIMVFFQVPSVVRYDPSIPFGDPDDAISFTVFIIQIMIVIIFVVTEGIAWMMPEWFKKYLNEKYKFTFGDEDPELTEEMVLDRLKKALWDDIDD